MRISDWSSDVCSSDLPLLRMIEATGPSSRHGRRAWAARVGLTSRPSFIACLGSRNQGTVETVSDRKSAVEGKSVSVRVEHGGRRIMTKKKNKKRKDRKTGRTLTKMKIVSKDNR